MESMAQVVLSAGGPIEFERTLIFLRDALGFKLTRIGPADDPSQADLEWHGKGLSIALHRASPKDKQPVQAKLRISVANPTAFKQEVQRKAKSLGVFSEIHPNNKERNCEGGDGESLLGPNGTVIELHTAGYPMHMPPLNPARVISTITTAAFNAGRAGMLYRDLIPCRQGGRYVASHIRIPNGGPVPDYVHYHRVQFQLIYCYRGWVKVVYEDQGNLLSFILRPGDAVLQPPEIRHQVLESSSGLEVVEIGCPAIHDTFAGQFSGPTLSLPNATQPTQRPYNVQGFMRHVANTRENEVESTMRPWQPSILPGFEASAMAVADNTKGIASVATLRPSSAATHIAGSSEPITHDGDFYFLFVLEGNADVAFSFSEHGIETTQHLSPGDSVVIPAGDPFVFTSTNPHTRVLEVNLPAQLVATTRTTKGRSRL